MKPWKQPLEHVLGITSGGYAAKSYLAENPKVYQFPENNFLHKYTNIFIQRLLKSIRKYLRLT